MKRGGDSKEASEDLVARRTAASAELALAAKDDDIMCTMIIIT